MSVTEEPIEVLERAAQILLDLADSMDEELKTNQYWQSELVGRDQWYANGVRNGLGGQSGELAALFTPELARLQAETFRAWARMGRRADVMFLDRVGGRETIRVAEGIVRATAART